MTTFIQDFTMVSLTSILTLHLVRLSSILKFFSPMQTVYVISICIINLTRYKVIILPCEVVNLVIGIGQGIG